MLDYVRKATALREAFRGHVDEAQVEPLVLLPYDLRQGSNSS